MCADKEAAACKEALAQFNKIVSGLGELIKAAQIQVSDASAAEAAKYSVDAAALSTDPCKLDIVLLPFDEDKGGPEEEWQHFSGLPFQLQCVSDLTAMILVPAPCQGICSLCLLEHQPSTQSPCLSSSSGTWWQGFG